MGTVRVQKPVKVASVTPGARPLRVATGPGLATPRAIPVYTPRVVLTEGQRLLCRVDASLADMARELGVSQACVCFWRQGERNPGPALRARLRAAYGIPVRAWESTPRGGYVVGGEDEAVDTAEARAEGDTDEHVDAPEPPRTARGRRDVAEAGEPSALDDYNRLLSQLRRQLARPNLPSRERIQISDAFSRALVHKARLERSRELLDARVIREHPRWKELKAAITAALLEHPAAARDVEAAIVRVLGVDDGGGSD